MTLPLYCLFCSHRLLASRGCTIPSVLSAAPVSPPSGRKTRTPCSVREWFSGVWKDGEGHLLSYIERICPCLYSNECSLEADLSDSLESIPSGSPSNSVFTSIQLIKVNLKKKVKFLLEGHLPESTLRKNRMFHGLATPQLPRPGERIVRKNALRIERQAQQMLVRQP